MLNRLKKERRRRSSVRFFIILRNGFGSEVVWKKWEEMRLYMRLLMSHKNKEKKIDIYMCEKKERRLFCFQD